MKIMVSLTSEIVVSVTVGAKGVNLIPEFYLRFLSFYSPLD